MKKFKLIFIIFLQFMVTEIRSEWNIKNDGEYRFHRDNREIRQIDITDDFVENSLDSYISFLEDKDHHKIIEDLIYSNNYIEIEYNGTTPNFSYSKSKYWGYFQFKDERKDNFDVFLINNFPILDYIKLSCHTKSKEVYFYESGDHIPIEKWNQNFRKQSFKLPKNLSECWIEIYGDSSLQISLTLHKEEAFHKYVVYDTFIQSMYYGGLITILLYNLFLSLSNKIFNYVNYCIFLTTYGLFQASFSGIGYLYIWPNISPQWVDKIRLFFGSIAFISSYSFTLNLLDFKFKSEKLKWSFILVLSIHISHLLFLPFVTDLAPFFSDDKKREN